MTAGVPLVAKNQEQKPAVYYGSTDVMSGSGPSYIDSLNTEQRHAVESTDGPLLILAGAGTGKTRVLTTRIAHIINQGRAFSNQLLAVTFTNKAAHEMRERVSTLLGRSVDSLWIGTFHSIAVRILRRHAECVGLRSNFTILDADDQLRLVKQLIRAEGLDEKKFIPRAILGAINRLKDKGVKPIHACDYEDVVVTTIYQQYQERLIILNAADFGDLLLHNLTIFQEYPEILAQYQQQFRYVLVDEYQDTNSSQYIWLRLLVKESGNICCVGDDDQSIYGWRGAEIGNILRFEKDFPGAILIRLEQNYRSTAPILKAASGLIAHNKGRYGKTLWTEQQEGEPIYIRANYDGDEEARSIGDEIENIQRQGNPLSSVAILVRAGFQTRTFEECFMQMAISYRVIGGPRFYERQEIRDSLAYLRLVIQEDDGLAFERVINLPRRGIGDTTVQRLHQFAREQGISIPKAAKFAAHQQLPDVPLQAKARASLQSFFADLDRWRAALETEPHAEVVKRILDESGYTGIWIQDKSPDAAGRLENIRELVQVIGQFETLQGFLEHVSLVLDTNNNNTEDMVTIMTLHAAKGLEFDTVFLAGWEEGLFPHPRSLAESNGAGLEEERRLAYVGLSRARKKAIVSYAFMRRAPQGWQNAIPSRFISEIPKDVVIHQNAYGRDMTSSVALSREPFTTHTMRYGQNKGQYSNPSYMTNRNQNYGAKATPVKTAVDELVTHSFKTGDRVFHTKFGMGSILAFEGDKLHIQFDANGLKKIIADFVQKSA